MDIEVVEPFQLSGKVSGVIIDMPNENCLFVRLKESLEGKKIKSELAELHPRTANEIFSSLVAGGSIMVNGALIEEATKELEFTFIGRMKVLDTEIVADEGGLFRS